LGILEKYSCPKIIWGLGYQNIYAFAGSAAKKCVWIIIDGKGLLSKVVFQIYIDPLCVEYWIRSPTKSFHNASMIWKVVVWAFPLVGKWLVWKVVSKRKFRF
jgi:hypothetical protein